MDQNKRSPSSAMEYMRPLCNMYAQHHAAGHCNAENLQARLCTRVKMCGWVSRGHKQSVADGGDLINHQDTAECCMMGY